jgi:hypothetical protein
MNKLLFVALLVLTACAGYGGIRPGEKYISPFADFSCGPFTLNTEANAAFGPHGGTVRFVYDIFMLRVDVEELQPVLDKTMLNANIERLYQGYLAQSTMPLIKSAIPNASVIKEGIANLNGLKVYQSVVVTPGNSSTVSGDGRRLDGLRGIVQYTNGRYMFTVTEFVVAWPNLSKDEQIALAVTNAERSFKLCSFPD